jgi:hypothetical protein
MKTNGKKTWRPPDPSEQAIQRLKSGLSYLRKLNPHGTIEKYAELCLALEMTLSAAYYIYDEMYGYSVQHGLILRPRPEGLPPTREENSE